MLILGGIGWFFATVIISREGPIGWLQDTFSFAILPILLGVGIVLHAADHAPVIDALDADADLVAACIGRAAWRTSSGSSSGTSERSSASSSRCLARVANATPRT
jgi:hypothetical protein